MQSEGPELLTDFRKRGGYSQEELGRMAGASRGMIAQVEQGRRRPSRSLLRDLCDALGLEGIERAALFIAFQRLPPGPQNTLTNIAAVLRLDRRLSAGQSEALNEMIGALYRQALQENHCGPAPVE